MRLLGANRVADLNMQHVSLFGTRSLIIQKAVIDSLFARSMQGLWNSRSMMGLLALRSSGCGYRRSCRRSGQMQMPLSITRNTCWVKHCGMMWCGMNRV